MIDSMHLLKVLRERGYWPNDDAETYGNVPFDRALPHRVIRVVLAEDGAAEVYMLRSGTYVHEWHATFTPGTPGAALLAVLDAAEAQAGAAGGAELLIASLRRLPEEEFGKVCDAIKAWDAADYDGIDDASDDLAEWLLGREVCHCGGKIRHGQCRDCGETYESEPATLAGEDDLS